MTKWVGSVGLAHLACYFLRDLGWDFEHTLPTPARKPGLGGLTGNTFFHLFLWISYKQLFNFSLIFDS
jgi:hypothetical protein